jgi:hypothetical protein
MLAINGGGVCAAEGELVAEPPPSETSVMIDVDVTGTNPRCFGVKAVYPNGLSELGGPDEGDTAFNAFAIAGPIDAGACSGGSATFSVEAFNATHFQWYQDGKPVGTDSDTLELNDLSSFDNGSMITVVISGKCEPAWTSAPALLKVFNGPSFSPIETIAASRFIDGEYLHFCPFSGGGGCAGSDFKTAACFEPFFDSINLHCEESFGIGTDMVHASSISGTRLEGFSSGQAAAGVPCLGGGGSAETTSRYEVTFVLDSPLPYEVTGEISADCTLCEPVAAAPKPEASFTLSHVEDGVVYSIKKGGDFDAFGEEDFGTAAIAASGTLPAGTYTLVAEATAIGASGNGTFSSASFEFAFDITLAGDVDGDAEVDGEDLGLLLSAWGPCAGCPADLNGDGVVDGADLGILLASWTG